MSELDIAANRAATKWSKRELIGRVLWRLAAAFFRWSPRPLWSWRRFMLRCFGASIGEHVHVYPTVKVTIPWNIRLGDHVAVGDGAKLYALGMISVGCRTTISQGVHLCAGSHDLHQRDRPLTKPPISIGSDVWIAADAFIGPGVTIGKNAVVGARCVAVRSVPENQVVGGNPARKLREIP